MDFGIAETGIARGSPPGTTTEVLRFGGSVRGNPGRFTRPPLYPEHRRTTQAQLPWEGPFTVAKVTGPGSYRLQTLEGEDINNSWNVDQLCRFYA
jgi:hypothetical protein